MLKFCDLNIGDKFSCNGNNCTKRSSRMAYIDGDKKELWFYFGYNEVVSFEWK